MTKTHIVLHHSLTEDGKTVSWSAIRQYHVKTNGWRDIGYHFGIEDINGTLEILFGRLPNEDGAHCQDAGMNRKGIGICLVGNFDAQVPTTELWSKARGLVLYLMDAYKIPAENVIGHREAQASLPLSKRKSCPGKLFNMDRFRKDLKQGG